MSIWLSILLSTSSLIFPRTPTMSFLLVSPFFHPGHYTHTSRTLNLPHTQFVSSLHHYNLNFFPYTAMLSYKSHRTKTYALFQVFPFQYPTAHPPVWHSDHLVKWHPNRASFRRGALFQRSLWTLGVCQVGGQKRSVHPASLFTHWMNHTPCCRRGRLQRQRTGACCCSDSWGCCTSCVWRCSMRWV